jgi:hypothetical protein
MAVVWNSRVTSKRWSWHSAWFAWFSIRKYELISSTHTCKLSLVHMTLRCKWDILFQHLPVRTQESHGNLVRTASYMLNVQNTRVFSLFCRLHVVDKIWQSDYLTGTRILRAQRWQPYCHLWADCPYNVGSLTSHNPIGLHGLLWG